MATEKSCEIMIRTYTLTQNVTGQVLKLRMPTYIRTPPSRASNINFFLGKYSVDNALSLVENHEILQSTIFSQLPLYVEKVFTEIDDIIHPDSQVDQNTSNNNVQILHDLVLVCMCHIQTDIQCLPITNVTQWISKHNHCSEKG